ncbi:MAG TPA: ABC transporter permease [Rugosimonospora sp.]|nr:ABC transporter permease [Rugosimonospora sp.]
MAGDAVTGARTRLGPVGTLLVRRGAMAVLLLFAVSALTFVLVGLIPGDPAADILGSQATTDQYAALDQRLGLDRPIWTQYGGWLAHAVRGDLGSSLISGTPVTTLLDSALSVTVPLVLGALVLSTVLGVGLGVLAATRGGFAGRIVDAGSLVGLALPDFWIALVLSEYFGVRLGWLPATGFVPFGQSPVDWFASLVLPWVTLAVAGAASIAKQTRNCVDDVLHRDFVDALLVDGIGRGRILVRHVLRNAAVPVVATVGVSFVAVLGGTVIVENVFALPGLGRAAVSATTQHDLPVLVGCAVYFCIAVVLVNLATDLAYGALNPRARVS